MTSMDEMNVRTELMKELAEVESYLEQTLTTDSEDFNELIRPLSAAGGKRLRAQLCLLIARAGKSQKEDRIKIAAAIEMLHLATLIHDDVLDQAALRRGVEAIHCSHGNKVAILSGDYLFAKAFTIVTEVGSVACLAVFSRVISALVQGEFMQMEDVHKLDQGVERYLGKTKKKTADFIEACMELGGILGQWPGEQIEYLKAYGQALGMAFQITDDIMDYRESKATTGKPVGKDLREGILTYPLLSIVTEENHDAVEKEVDAILAGGDEDKLIAYVIAQGGVDNTLALEEHYCKAAFAALDGLPDFTGKIYLDQVIRSLATRKV